MKETICAIFGAVGGAIAWALGGWDAALITLVLFMAIDYATGLLVAAVFHKSKHSASGAIQSRAGWKGLCKKCVTLLFVLIANRLDLIIGTTYIRDAVVIAFITNELISIIENAGLMGIPMPNVLKKAIDVLTDKAESGGAEK